MHIAAGRPAANSYLLAPADLIDPQSGRAVPNGIPVRVTPA